MKTVFYHCYRVLRSVIVTGSVIVLSLFVALYLILIIPSVQNKIRTIGEEELSKKLNTQVKIGSISISPFNQVVLYDVEVPDQSGRQLLNVSKLGTSISLYKLISDGRFVFNYAEIIGLNGHIIKENPKSPVNFQFIVDALSSKDKNKPPTKFDIAIYNIVIRKSALSYDVLSEAKRPNGLFDKNHISLSELMADVSLPRLKNEDFKINIKRLSFKEKCGLDLEKLTTDAEICDTNISLKKLRIELPNTLITPDDIQINFSSLKTLKDEILQVPIEVNIPNSYVTLSDLSGFVKPFEKFTNPMKLTLAVRGTVRNIDIPVLNVSTDNDRISVNLNGSIKDIDNKYLMKAHLPHIQVKANADEIAKLTSNFAKLSPLADKIIRNCGNVNIDAFVSGTLDKALFSGKIGTSLGAVAIDGNFARNELKKTISFNGNVKTPGFKLGALLDKQNILDETALDVDLNAIKDGKTFSGKIDGNITYIDLKGYRYNNIVANVGFKPKELSGRLTIDDENVGLVVDGMAKLDGSKSRYDLVLDAAHVNLAKLNLTNKYKAYDLNFGLNAAMSGNDLSNLNGSLDVQDFSFVDANNNGVHLDNFSLVANKDSIPNSITVKSDVLNGEIVGNYDFKTVVPSVKRIIAESLPSLMKNYSVNNKLTFVNNFTYNFEIANNDKLNDILTFFKSPVNVLYPVTLSGYINDVDTTFCAIVDAPYLEQKNKLIEGSHIEFLTDRGENNVQIHAQSLYPTKNGKIALSVNGNGVNDRIDTNVSWKLDRKADYHGTVDVSIGLKRDEDDQSLLASMVVNPTELVFNDTTWNMYPSKVDIGHHSVTVDNFKLGSDNQYLTINGKASKDAADELKVDLNDINLDYIFQTLAINNVEFGGRATGTFYASDLYTKMPRLSTDNLHVENMKYNNALLGNADIASRWDGEDKCITINAKIKQPNNCESDIKGGIYPTLDSLCFDFNAERINVEFMKPFLSAITSDLQGEASGYARLYGNFSRINLLGDVLAQDLKVKVDYTNVYYTCSDSIKIVPGYITFKDVTLHDRDNHTAKLSGWVKHRNFHDASFNFSVTNAENFLCYDITQRLNPDWYGTIYGNGSAFVTGKPGVVNIDVNMETAPNSKFTFVLSDTEAASEYSFITFRDKNRDKKKAEEEQALTEREIIERKFQKKQAEQEKSMATVVNINLQAEVKPDAQLVLVMDPVGGDKIRANGQGNLRLAYNSADDEMTMYGKYTLTKGFYNFTLQDIIVKDFQIKEGSSISFHGDPMAANIDIDAIYALNANLQDLDESFATDKEMNRTSVPVHALLKVTGDIEEPNIGFDLEFPTLTSDAYRKVKSVISTDDMMNRQIIYLLALNRFYTPDYMGTSNTNNELASVASSTISSQLSNMLGQLSENWSIAPNFKSDKGDFSDVEVNLALSSHLLNNRLLFNGNLGYRDNTMNTRNSNFIGDFDLEYLLTKNGNIRLKAYNHYNDQNYYVKSALTTQGVGVVFKRDFDRPFDFLKNWKKAVRKDSVQNKKESVDSIK